MTFTLLRLLMLMALAVAIMTVGVLFLLKIMVRSAPKDIQEIILKRPDDPKWKTAVGFLLMAVLFAGVIGLFVWEASDARRAGLGLGQTFLRFLILLDGYKLFDMVFFDWIVLTKLNIFQKVAPETVGCKGYESFGFNLKSQIIKLFVFAGLALVTAALVTRV